MDQYFRELNIDMDLFEQIRQEIETCITDNYDPQDTNVYFANQELFDNLPTLKYLRSDILNLGPVTYMFAIINSGDPFQPHRDNTIYPWSLILPIKNTKNTTLSFYNSTSAPILKIDSDPLGEEKKWWWVDPDTCFEVCSLELTRPTFIHVHELHGVVNQSGLQRWSFSIMPLHNTPINITTLSTSYIGRL